VVQPIVRNLQSLKPAATAAQPTSSPLVRTTSHVLIITAGCPSVCLSHSCAAYLITTSTSYITRCYNNGWVSVCLSVCPTAAQPTSSPLVRPTSHVLIITVGVSVCLSVCLSHSCAAYLITTSTSYLTRCYNNGWVSVCLSVPQLRSLPHHN